MLSRATFSWPWIHNFTTEFTEGTESRRMLCLSYNFFAFFFSVLSVSFMVNILLFHDTN
jgi:hypothetical protein